MKLYYSNLVVAATLLPLIVADPSRTRTRGQDRGRRNHARYLDRNRVPDGEGNRGSGTEPEPETAVSKVVWYLDNVRLHVLH